MTTSQNGWEANANPALIDIAPFIYKGVAFPQGVRSGDVATVLTWVVEQLDINVEPIKTPGCWGFDYRPISGSGGLSNHSSGTAVDYNAPKHPLGAVGTFTKSQVAAIHAILGQCEGVVRWGGDYTGRVDEMHFEINAPAAAVARLAVKLTKDTDVAIDPKDPVIVGLQTQLNKITTLLEWGDATRPEGLQDLGKKLDKLIDLITKE